MTTFRLTTNEIQSNVIQKAIGIYNLARAGNIMDVAMGVETQAMDKAEFLKRYLISPEDPDVSFPIFHTY
jgi:hypothetical protein